jgi:hypothetical protein
MVITSSMLMPRSPAWDKLSPESFKITRRYCGEAVESLGLMKKDSFVSYRMRKESALGRWNRKWILGYEKLPRDR